MHGLERVTEFVVAGWLLLNTLGIVLVQWGWRGNMPAWAWSGARSQAGEVVFDQALTLTE